MAHRHACTCPLVPAIASSALLYTLQVMKAKFETVVYLAQNTPFGKKSAHCVFPGLVDKLGDIKVSCFSHFVKSCWQEVMYVSIYRDYMS